MNPELDAALVRDFPLLFAARHASMEETAMCWGFECGNGWEPLIRRGAERLEELIEAFDRASEGNDEFLPRASQVKEKYGTLCFYMTTGTDDMYYVIKDMEDESEITCETCGSAGRLASTGGWYKTLCAEHLGERYEFVKGEKKDG